MEDSITIKAFEKDEFFAHAFDESGNIYLRIDLPVLSDTAFTWIDKDEAKQLGQWLLQMSER